MQRSSLGAAPEKVLTRLQADADALEVARTKATVGALPERWMDQHESDPTTRMTYEAQIHVYIVPNLGDVPLVLFVREAAERLEKLYGRLQLCPATGLEHRPWRAGSLRGQALPGPVLARTAARAAVKPHAAPLV